MTTDLSQDPLVIEAADPQTPTRRIAEIVKEGVATYRKTRRQRLVLQHAAGNPSASTETLMALVNSYPDIAFKNPTLSLIGIENPALLTEAVQRAYAQPKTPHTGLDEKESLERFARFAEWLRTEAPPAIRHAATCCGPDPDWRKLNLVSADFFRSFGARLDPDFIVHAYVAAMRSLLGGYASASFSRMSPHDVRRYCAHMRGLKLPLGTARWWTGLGPLRGIGTIMLPALVMCRHRGVPNEERRLVQTFRAACCFLDDARDQRCLESGWATQGEDIPGIAKDLRWLANRLGIGRRLDPAIALRIGPHGAPEREGLVRTVHALIRQGSWLTDASDANLRHAERVERVLTDLSREPWRNAEVERGLRKALGHGAADRAVVQAASAFGSMFSPKASAAAAPSARKI